MLQAYTRWWITLTYIHRPSTARRHHLPAAPPQRPADPATAARKVRPYAPMLRRMCRVTPPPACLSSRPHSPPRRYCDRPSTTRRHHRPALLPPRPAAPALAALKAKQHLLRTRHASPPVTCKPQPLFVFRRRLSNCRCAGRLVRLRYKLETVRASTGA